VRMCVCLCVCVSVCVRVYTDMQVHSPLLKQRPTEREAKIMENPGDKIEIINIMN